MIQAAQIDQADVIARKVLHDLISQGLSFSEARDIIQDAKNLIGEIELQILDEQGKRPLSDFISL